MKCLPEHSDSCILQVIKNWTVGRTGNEASSSMQIWKRAHQVVLRPSSCWSFPVCKNWGGRSGTVYLHTSEINVYLGRQRGRSPQTEEHIWGLFTGWWMHAWNTLFHSRAPPFPFLPRYVDIDVIHVINGPVLPPPSVFLHAESDQKLDSSLCFHSIFTADCLLSRLCVETIWELHTLTVINSWLHLQDAVQLIR